MRQSTIDFYQRKDALAKRAERLARSKERAADPRLPANQRKAFLEDARINRLAEAENQRKLAQQALINKGNLNRTDREQVGELTKTNLEQTGESQRAKLLRDIAKDQYILDKFKTFTAPSADGVPGNPVERAVQFQVMQEPNDIQNNRSSARIQRSDGSGAYLNPNNRISQVGTSFPDPGIHPDPGIRPSPAPTPRMDVIDPAFNQEAYEEYLARKRRLKALANIPQAPPPNIQSLSGLDWLE